MTAGGMTWFWALSLVLLSKVTALNLSAKVAAILLKKKRMNTSPAIQSLVMVASAIGSVIPFSSAPVKTLKAPAPLVRG
jgi:fumarate reductase subunit C